MFDELGEPESQRKPPLVGHLQKSTLLPPTYGEPLKVWGQGNCKRLSSKVLFGL